MVQLNEGKLNQQTLNDLVQLFELKEPRLQFRQYPIQNQWDPQGMESHGFRLFLNDLFCPKDYKGFKSILTKYQDWLEAWQFSFELIQLDQGMDINQYLILTHPMTQQVYCYHGVLGVCLDYEPPQLLEESSVTTIQVIEEAKQKKQIELAQQQELLAGVKGFDQLSLFH